MTLTGVARRLTAAELAREPRSLAVIAYFDGYGAGAYGRHGTYVFPRRLDRNEAEQWRAGFAEGHTERVCQSWHGCTRCRGDHELRLATDDEQRASLAAVVQLELAEHRRAQASNGSTATE